MTTPRTRRPWIIWSRQFDRPFIPVCNRNLLPIWNIYQTRTDWSKTFASSRVDAYTAIRKAWGYWAFSFEILRGMHPSRLSLRAFGEGGDGEYRIDQIIQIIYFRIPYEYTIGKLISDL
jgi:hypothetical protein